MALNINGTTGISGVDGSASAPALQGTDSNTGINFASDTVNINTGGVTRATVDSSGRLLIGTTTEGGQFADDLTIANSGHTGITIRSGTDSVGSLYFSDGTSGDDEYRGAVQYNHTSNFLRFYSDATERMRIDSSGGLRLGTTSSNYDELFTIVESGTNNEIATWRVNDGGHTKDMLNMIHVANSGNRVMIRFRRTGSLTSVGDIVTSASSTSYVTSSDYRLKENVTSITDGITRLKTLKPYRFNFKIEPDKTVDGFLAHEASEVVPEAVVGEKDAVDAEGNIDAQAIDQSKLVPLLTAALQEEISKRESLETRVAALEAA